MQEGQSDREPGPEAAAPSWLLAEARWTPSLQEFQAYARLSGDDNPIHLDPVYAAGHLFGRPVSHGMLIHARLWALGQSLGQASGAARGGAPGPKGPVGPSPDLAVALEFPAPAYADDPLTLRLWQCGAEIRAEALRADGTAVCRACWQSAPPAGRAPARMPLGAEAELTRGYRPEDLAAFHALCGGQPDGFLPEPLIAALFSRLLGTRLPGPGTGWLKQELHHLARARPAETLTARVEVTRLRPDKGLVDLDCRCWGDAGRLLCRGGALMLLSRPHSLQI